MSKYSYAGKTVLITGSARGIGWETARRLHAGGAKLALVGLEPELLAERVALLGADRAAWFEADVTNFAALETAVAGTVERFGGLDIVIANAGVHYVGALATAPLAQLEREIEINLMGVVRTNKAVVPHLLKSGGYLLNIASLAAASHAPLMASYAASKAGVEAFSDSIRVELAPQGVAVGCAYFGFIDTDMVRDAMDDESTQVLTPLMPKFVRGSVSVDHAVDAIERAVLKRGARTWAPKYVGGALASRGVLQPLTEKRMMAAKGTMLKALKLAEKAVVHDRAGALKKGDTAETKPGAAKAKTEKAGSTK